MTWHASDTLQHTLDLGRCTWELGRCTMSLMCHLESREPPPWTLHPFEDVEVWFDDVAFDDDSTPLWRGHGALFLDDIMIGSLRMLHM
jgi:hypothetical protein